MKFLIKKVLDYLANKKNKENKDLNEIITYLVKIYTQENKKFTSNEIVLIVEIIRDLQGTSLVESLKIIENIIKTYNIDGDICEFGVAQGKTSKLMSYLIKNSEKKIFLFDSFQGLPKASKQDILKDDIFNLGTIEKYEGKMAHSETKVIEELNSIKFDLSKVIINKGFFNKENLHKFKFPSSIAFAYVDFDYYQPTLDVLNSIENKLQIGSVIIIDDYDFFSTGAKTAVDEWMQSRKDIFQINFIKTLNSSFAIINKMK